jgi:hypothetical protein
MGKLYKGGKQLISIANDHAMVWNYFYQGGSVVRVAAAHRFWRPTLKQGWLVLTRILMSSQYRSIDT